VAVEPTGSNVAVTGIRVSIEPMWWWSRISTISACSKQDAPPGRGDQVRARDQPDRPALRVDHHRRAVVALLDLLGDLLHQELTRRGQRLALHQRAAGGGQRDHPARDVAVQRRDDHRGPALLSQREDLVGRLGVVGQDEQLGAPVDREALGVRAVAHHDRVALGGAAARGVHRVHPDATGERLVLAGEEPAAEDLDDRGKLGGSVLEGRRLARLANEAAGQGPLREHADERAVVVDHGDELESGPGHLDTGLADRRLYLSDREARLHHVACADHHVGKELGLGRIAAPQQPARLGVASAQADGDVAVAGVHATLELGVADGRRDRIGVGVAVPGDVDGRHAGDYRR
jgi:hypothetical protein